MSSEITFNDSKYKVRPRTLVGTSEVPGMIKFLVINRIVKNESQAKAVILGVVVLLISISAYLINTSVAVQPAIPSPSIITDN